MYGFIVRFIIVGLWMSVGKVWGYDFSIMPRPAGESHKYGAQILIDGLNEFREVIEVRRRRVAGEPKWEKIELLRLDRAFWDAGIPSPGDYEYEVEIKNRDFAESFKKTLMVTIPPDLVFDEAEEFSQDSLIRAGRIFFKENVRWYLNGNRLSLMAVELVSDKAAEITSFVQGCGDGMAGSNRLKGTDGLSQNEVTMVAARASGVLTLSLAGGNGGDGEAGRPGADGGKGLTGKAAWRTEVVDGVQTNFKFPTDGFPGLPGAVGENGTDAGHGGSIFPIRFLVPVPGPFFLLDKISPGRGGRGGAGGKGGKGGEGGEPGYRASLPAARLGPRGPDGRDGNAGKDGEPGKNLGVCIWMGEQNKGGCDAY